jgi:uncharacterized protein involved in exopolysaccharide biosynthesis
LGKCKLLILGAGIFFALLLFLYGRHNRVVYTAKATIFPLTNQSENTLSTSALSGILGIEGTSKSFSSEAAINIVELTLSRNVRQKVAATRLPQFGNKTIGELIIQDLNDHSFFWQKKLTIPSDSIALASVGGEILSDYLSAKMSKTEVLEIYFSNASKPLITPITNVLIEKLSQFYIDLKTSKALADYNFTVKKIDSLEGRLSQVDKRAIVMQNTTFFTPTDRLEYDLPKENLSMEKSRILRQRDQSVTNREEATWRLQKATPIISVLDKPTEPFAMSKTSSVLLGIGGFIVGSLVCIFFLTAGLLYAYTKSEINKSLFGDEPKLPQVL